MAIVRTVSFFHTLARFILVAHGVFVRAVYAETFE